MDFSTAKYQEVFDNFFNNGLMSGTYKCVFLHVLSDIGFDENDDLVGRKWINKEEDHTTLDLDFIAIRFIKIYWEISGIRMKHTNLSNLNIFDVISDEQKIHTRIPKLETLAAKNKSALRDIVIKRSILPEAFKALSETDFLNMFEKVGKRKIRFKNGLLEYIKVNRDDIKEKIQIKMCEYLQKWNKSTVDGSVDASNPYFKYLMDKRIFLIGIDREETVRYFEKSMQNKISLDIKDEIVEVYVWGLKTTSDNERIWKQVQRDDIILFSKDGQCVAKGTVRGIATYNGTTKHPWSAEDSRDLLIGLDTISRVYIDLESTTIKLVNPVMSDVYKFPITQVRNELVSVMSSEYGGIGAALDNMSQPLEKSNIHNVALTIEEGKTKYRKGQQAFRTQILNNYHNTCVVCDICDKELLEAAHIIPVGDQTQAGIVRNGICFCVLHHTMFDKQYISFDCKRKLVFTRNTSKFLRRTFTKTQIGPSACTKPLSIQNLEKRNKLLKYTQRELSVEEA